MQVGSLSPKGKKRRIAVALAKSEKERIVKEVKEVASSASSLVISDARGLKLSLIHISEPTRPY